MILVGLTRRSRDRQEHNRQDVRAMRRLYHRCRSARPQGRGAGTPAWRAIVRAFGKTVLNSDHTLNRRAMAAIVLANPTKLRRLERIIHPRVAREQARLTRQATREDPQAVVIYDVPLLFEAGIDTRVKKIIVVTADRQTQITRLKKRNGFSRADALRRIRSQMPIKLKTAAADYLLDGTTARSHLLVQVRRLYRELRALA